MLQSTRKTPKQKKISQTKHLFQIRKLSSSSSPPKLSRSSSSPRANQHIKLNKNQIEHIKSLHTPNGRLKSKSFLLEGRKLIESVCLIKHTSSSSSQSRSSHLQYQPHDIYMNLDQYNELVDLLDQSEQLRRSPTQSSTPPSSPSTHINTASTKLSSLLNTYKCDSFLNDSIQHKWIEREDGRLAPPAIHSLNSSKSVTLLSPQQKTLYKHLIDHATIVESSLLTRLSQFSTPPGIICEYPFLSNIITFPTFSQKEYYDINHGTIFKPQFYSSSESNQSVSRSEWNWLNGGLVLYGLNDPGNVGTLIRTAHSFGIEQILLVDSADVYNHKAISASVGSLSSPSILSCSSAHFIQLMESTQDFDDTAFESFKIHSESRNNTPLAQLHQPFLVGLTPTRGIALDKLPNSLQEHISSLFTTPSNHGQKESSTLEMLKQLSNPLQQSNKPWLVIGSEAYGLPAQIEAFLHTTSTIKMSDDNSVGSLNAAIAGSIAAFHFAAILKQ